MQRGQEAEDYSYYSEENAAVGDAPKDTSTHAEATSGSTGTGNNAVIPVQSSSDMPGMRAESSQPVQDSSNTDERRGSAMQNMDSNNLSAATTADSQEATATAKQTASMEQSVSNVREDGNKCKDDASSYYSESGDEAQDNKTGGEQAESTCQRKEMGVQTEITMVDAECQTDLSCILRRDVGVGTDLPGVPLQSADQQQIVASAGLATGSSSSSTSCLVQGSQVDRLLVSARISSREDSSTQALASLQQGSGDASVPGKHVPKKRRRRTKKLESAASESQNAAASLQQQTGARTSASSQRLQDRQKCDDKDVSAREAGSVMDAGGVEVKSPCSQTGAVGAESTSGQDLQKQLQSVRQEMEAHDSSKSQKTGEDSAPDALDPPKKEEHQGSRERPDAQPSVTSSCAASSSSDTQDGASKHEDKKHDDDDVVHARSRSRSVKETSLTQCDGDKNQKTHESSEGYAHTEDVAKRQLSRSRSRSKSKDAETKDQERSTKEPTGEGAAALDKDAERHEVQDKDRDCERGDARRQDRSRDRSSAERRRGESRRGQSARSDRKERRVDAEKDNRRPSSRDKHRDRGDRDRSRHEVRGRERRGHGQDDAHRSRRRHEERRDRTGGDRHRGGHRSHKGDRRRRRSRHGPRGRSRSRSRSGPVSQRVCLRSASRPPRSPTPARSRSTKRLPQKGGGNAISPRRPATRSEKRERAADTAAVPKSAERQDRHKQTRADQDEPQKQDHKREIERSPSEQEPQRQKHNVNGEMQQPHKSSDAHATSHAEVPISSGVTPWQRRKELAENSREQSHGDSQPKRNNESDGSFSGSGSSADTDSEQEKTAADDKAPQKTSQENKPEQRPSNADEQSPPAATGDTLAERCRQFLGSPSQKGKDAGRKPDPDGSGSSGSSSKSSSSAPASAAAGSKAAPAGAAAWTGPAAAWGGGEAKPPGQHSEKSSRRSRSRRSRHARRGAGGGPGKQDQATAQWMAQQWGHAGMHPWSGQMPQWAPMTGHPSAWASSPWAMQYPGAYNHYAAHYSVASGSSQAGRHSDHRGGKGSTRSGGKYQSRSDVNRRESSRDRARGRSDRGSREETQKSGTGQDKDGTTTGSTTAPALGNGAEPTKPEAEKDTATPASETGTRPEKGTAQENDRSEAASADGDRASTKGCEGASEEKVAAVSEPSQSAQAPDAAGSQGSADATSEQKKKAHDGPVCAADGFDFS